MPICVGSGWVKRMPSTVITTTKSVPVSRRTASASGCSAADRVRAGHRLAHRRACPRTCARRRASGRRSRRARAGRPGGRPRPRRRPARRRPRAPAARTAVVRGSMRARGSPYEMYETVSTTTQGRILRRMPAAPSPATASASRPDRTHYLYLSVIAAVVLGIIVGLVAPSRRQGRPTARHGVRRADQDDDLAGHLLHDRAGHRLGPQGRPGRQGRRPRARLLPGDVHVRAGDRPARRQHHPARARACTSPTLAGTAPLPQAKAGGGLPARASSRPRCSRRSSASNVLPTLFVALLVGFALQAMGRTAEPVLRGVGVRRRSWSSASWR